MNRKSSIQLQQKKKRKKLYIITVLLVLNFHLFLQKGSQTQLLLYHLHEFKAASLLKLHIHSKYTRILFLAYSILRHFQVCSTKLCAFCTYTSLPSTTTPSAEALCPGAYGEKFPVEHSCLYTVIFKSPGFT